MHSDTLDSFKTPDGNVLALLRRGTGFSIELDGQELMATVSTGSEVALAEIGCQELEAVVEPQVLIGGLGLGFTLRAALSRLPHDARLVVAELFPRVVEWNRTHLQGLYGSTLEDRRLEIVVSDVWDEVGRGTWNAILLDTDNGPEGFSLSRNNRLYGNVGLEHLRAGLAPGGVLAIWSANAEPGFVDRMKTAGLDARCRIVREHRSDGRRYAIFLGR